MEEGEGVQHVKIKINIKKDYKWWIKLVLSSEVNARNRIAAINTLAVPVILYNYGVIAWKLDDIQGLYKMTRKQLYMNWMLTKKADVDRIYIQFQEGGRSLMSLKQEYKATMIGLHKCVMISRFKLSTNNRILGSSLCTLRSWNIPSWGWNNR